MQKVDPLRYLALRTQTGRFKSSLSHGSSPYLHVPWWLMDMGSCLQFTGHLTDNQLHKVVGVNSRIPEVHIKAGVSLLNLVSLLFVHVFSSEVFFFFNL